MNGIPRYPKRRNLDDIYHIAERDGRREAVCWTDMTDAERERVIRMLEGHDDAMLLTRWWRMLAENLSDRLRGIADEIDYVRGDGCEDDVTESPDVDGC